MSVGRRNLKVLLLGAVIASSLSAALPARAELGDLIDQVVETTDPITTTVDETATSVVEPAAVPVVEAVDPVVEAVDPVLEPVEPVLDDTDRVLEPTDPTIDPDLDPTDPVLDPVRELTDPVLEPTPTAEEPAEATWTDSQGRAGTEPVTAVASRIENEALAIGQVEVALLRTAIVAPAQPEVSIAHVSQPADSSWLDYLADWLKTGLQAGLAVPAELLSLLIRAFMSAGSGLVAPVSILAALAVGARRKLVPASA